MAVSETHTADRQDTASVVGLPALSLAMWGGLAAWMVHLVAVLGMVGAACTHDMLWLIHATTVVTTVVAVVAIATGIRVIRVAGSTDGGGWDVSSREAFMAFVGVLLSAIGLMLILFEGIPAFVIDPCAPS